MNVLRRGLGRIGTLLGLLVAVTVTAPANGQIGEFAGFAEAMRPEYLRRDLQVFSEALELDDAQRDVLESLFDDYSTAFDTGLQTMQNRLQTMKDDLQAGDQQRILSMIFMPFQDWIDERRKLGESFLVNVHDIVLSDFQRKGWDAFRRRLRREKTMSDGSLSGESVNLSLVVRLLQLPLPVAEMMAPLMEEYELTVDQALIARADTMRTSRASMVESLQTRDPNRSVKLMKDQLKARVRVRDTNYDYLVRIGETLPGLHRDEFLADALSRAFPRAYRTTTAQRMYAAAVQLEDLDAELLPIIVDLQNVLEAEMAMFAQRLVEIILASEPDLQKNRIELYAAKMQGEALVKMPDPSIPEMRKRDLQADEYITLLQSMLTPEQFASLPGADRWLRNQLAAENKQRSDAAKKAASKAARQRDAARSREANQFNVGGSPSKAGGGGRSKGGRSSGGSKDGRSRGERGGTGGTGGTRGSDRKN
jgi:hypothetical protein